MSEEGTRWSTLMSHFEQVYKQIIRNSKQLAGFVSGPYISELPRKVLQDEIMEVLRRIFQEEEISKIRDTEVRFPDDLQLETIVYDAIKSFKNQVLLPNSQIGSLGWKIIWQILFVPFALEAYRVFFGPPVSATVISVLQDPRRRKFLREILRLLQGILEEEEEEDGNNEAE